MHFSLSHSDVLESQVRRLQPHLHLYGHTHIPLGKLLTALPIPLRSLPS
jgi:hypothetical protein